MLAELRVTADVSLLTNEFSYDLLTRLLKGLVCTVCTYCKLHSTCLLCITGQMAKKAISCYMVLEGLVCVMNHDIQLINKFLFVLMTLVSDLAVKHQHASTDNGHVHIARALISAIYIGMADLPNFQPILNKKKKNQ